MKIPLRKFLATTVVLLAMAGPVLAADEDPQLAPVPVGRERLLMDFNWRFA